MPFEVYTGSRPGKPKATLLFSALLLAAVLGLAWQQSREARALAPEQRVGDLPLYVRPPKNWLVDPEDPTAFILPVQREGWRQQAFRYERRIRFAFDRLPAYFSTQELLRSAGLDNPRTLASLQRAKIGPFDAVQVRHEVPFQIGRLREGRRARITRLTCLPNGIMLLVEYDALIDLRPADLEIIDEVCQTLRIDDPSVNRKASAYLDAAGLELELSEGWLAAGSKFPEVAGLYVGGTLDGWPAWSVGIFRTWLAPERTPDDLLLDFAVQEWLRPDLEESLTRIERADGAQIVSLAHPDLGRVDVVVPSVWLVTQTPSEAAILFVQSDISHAAAANEIARRIAGALRLRPVEPFERLDEALQAGRDLAEKLTRRGALPRWGRARVNAAWLGQSPRGPVRITTVREPRPDPPGGYAGWTETDLRRGERMIEETSWTLGPQARTYDLEIDFFRGSTEVSIREQRDRPTREVTRRVESEDRPGQRWRFRPSDRFVAPPAEGIVSWWVAYGTPSLALCEFSGPLTRGAHSMLLRQLPAPENRWRVLLQSDFRPQGIIETYDEASDQPLSQEGPTWSLQRVLPPPD